MTAGSLTICAGVPSAIFSPWLRTTTRWEMRMIAFITCSTRTMVTPLSRMLSMSRQAILDLVGIEAAQRLVEE
jgi:hypothetical protein